jgi:hypothetical protein
MICSRCLEVIIMTELRSRDPMRSCSGTPTYLPFHVRAHGNGIRASKIWAACDRGSLKRGCYGVAPLSRICMAGCVLEIEICLSYNGIGQVSCSTVRSLLEVRVIDRLQYKSMSRISMIRNRGLTTRGIDELVMSRYDAHSFTNCQFCLL